MPIAEVGCLCSVSEGGKGAKPPMTDNLAPLPSGNSRLVRLDGDTGSIRADRIGGLAASTAVARMIGWRARLMWVRRWP